MVVDLIGRNKVQAFAGILSIAYLRTAIWWFVSSDGASPDNQNLEIFFVSAREYTPGTSRVA